MSLPSALDPEVTLRKVILPPHWLLYLRRHKSTLWIYSIKLCILVRGWGWGGGNNCWRALVVVFFFWFFVTLRLLDAQIFSFFILALHGRRSVVQFLLRECGYKPTAEDATGQTPIQNAKTAGHLEIAQLMETRLDRTRGTGARWIPARKHHWTGLSVRPIRPIESTYENTKKWKTDLLWMWKTLCFHSIVLCDSHGYSPFSLQVSLLWYATSLLGLYDIYFIFYLILTCFVFHLIVYSASESLSLVHWTGRHFPFLSLGYTRVFCSDRKQFGSSGVLVHNNKGCQQKRRCSSVKKCGKKEKLIQSKAPAFEIVASRVA